MHKNDYQDFSRIRLHRELAAMGPLIRNKILQAKACKYAISEQQLTFHNESVGDNCGETPQKVPTYPNDNNKWLLGTKGCSHSYIILSSRKASQALPLVYNSNICHYGK